MVAKPLILIDCVNGMVINIGIAHDFLIRVNIMATIGIKLLKKTCFTTKFIYLDMTFHG